MENMKQANQVLFVSIIVEIHSLTGKLACCCFSSNLVHFLILQAYEATHPRNQVLKFSYALSKNCAEGNIKIISFNFLAYCFCFKASSNIFKVLFDKFKASSFKVKSRPDKHPSNAKLHGQIQTSFRIQQTQVAGVQQTWHRRQRL